MDAVHLNRHSGRHLYSAAHAMLKGLLETDVPVATVTVPRGEPFDVLLRIAGDEEARELLRRHEIGMIEIASADRAVNVARFAAQSGRASVALVPHDELARSASTLTATARTALPAGSAMAIVLEDRPSARRPVGPRELVRDIDLPAFEAANVAGVRDAVDSALRISRATRRVVAIIVHSSIMRTSQTLETRPNRVIESVDALLARRRRRRPRLAESTDVLRIIRRLELNRVQSLPSPGERLPVGFVTVGPADPALSHLVQVLNLVGRVPLVHLAAVHPVDAVVVSRLLTRCEQVIVLEPRPGAVEAVILEIAETLRADGKRPGLVWGRGLPPDPRGTSLSLDIDQALHPSLLARRTVHLLHMLRPSGRVASHLVPEPSPPAFAVPPRSANVGPEAAVAAVRRVLVDVDVWLRDQRITSEDPESETATGLAIDGTTPDPVPDRVVMTETWTSERFPHEGIAALRQAARDPRPWLFIVCDTTGDDGQDLTRLVRGTIPGARADRVRVEPANLADMPSLVELLREVVLDDRMTVVIVRDGPPARYDVAALERSLAEVDRLGFEPRERRVWPARRAGSVRALIEEEASDGDPPHESHASHDSMVLASSLRLERRSRHGSKRPGVRLRVRPILEEVEVTRTRPPARRWGRDETARLPRPEIMHADASQWRVHIAGFTGAAPGVVARVLEVAGQAMGYAVSSACDPTPIGPGRRAWAQILFTNPREDESPSPLATRVPFGEADLVLGIDATETLRAVAADPTLCIAVSDRAAAVVNIGHFRDEPDTEPASAMRDELRSVLKSTTRPEPRMVDDFAGACRAWFHTDRIVGLAALGAAFQRGLVPLSLDAIERGVADAEAAGRGRARESFRFGRHLALDTRLFSRPKEVREEPVEQVVRRVTRHLARRRFGGRARSEQFGHVLETALRSMPGLTETDHGRQARRDFVIAMCRCLHWGGEEYAEQYARLITELYRVDRGDAGRSLTRAAVLPLASVMLIEDPIFLASMATSAEERRRTRRLLNVNRARDDELQRRFLTRIEAAAFSFRLRAHVRSSDWPARFVTTVRHIIPTAWRGTRRQREVRDHVINLVERATREATQDYAFFQTTLAHLHEYAEDGRLMEMELSELATQPPR